TIRHHMLHFVRNARRPHLPSHCRRRAAPPSRGATRATVVGMRWPRRLSVALVALLGISTGSCRSCWADPDSAASTPCVGSFSGRDDLQFARELVHKGYPDLAVGFLDAMRRCGRTSPDLAPARRAAEIYDHVETAKRVEEPVKQIDALSNVLTDMQTFVDA